MAITPPIPTAKVEFQSVTGNPWTGMAICRFDGNSSERLAISGIHDSANTEEHRWYIEEFLDFPEGGNLTRARAVERDLISVGKKLWDAICCPTLVTWLAEVRRRGSGRLEFVAQTPSDEIALATPWEMLRPGLGEPPLQQLGVGIVRTMHHGEIQPTYRLSSKRLRVLLVVSRPTDAGFLDPRFTPRAILDALGELRDVSLDFCRPPTLASLVQRLEAARAQKAPYDVLHFDGHGDTGALYFEKINGTADRITAQDLAQSIAEFEIPLVILEACRSATPSTSYTTLAGVLLKSGVRSVIGMRHSVHVDMTREFCALFFGAIAHGDSVAASLTAARAHVYSRRGLRTRIAPDAPVIDLEDWFVPQLFQLADHHLVEDQSVTSALTQPVKVPNPPRLGFPQAPRAGFQGRGYVLHRLECEMAEPSPLVVHAPGGMGKTALACELASWLTETGMFPDGAVFLSLEGSPSPELLIEQLGYSIEGLDLNGVKLVRNMLRFQ